MTTGPEARLITSLFLDAAFGLSPAVLGLMAGLTGYGPTFLVSAFIAASASAYLLVRRPAGHPGDRGGPGIMPDARGRLSS